MRTQVQTRAGEARFDSSIAGLADLQHGVVERGQLLGMGLEPGAIGRRIRVGRLHQLHAGVYSVGHRVLSQRGQWMAAVLACGEGAVLSHRSAAALWGFRQQSSGPTHVTSPSKSRPTRTIRRHYSVLPSDEVTERDGIPVTTVPRTILDLAATEPPEVVEGALREAEYLRLDDPLSLPHLLERYPRRRGARAIRTALARRAESVGRTRSALEERFLAFLDRYDLPRPQLNAWLDVGGRRYEVDCLWPAARHIVELDGWQSHGTHTAFSTDRARDRRLRAAGYTIDRLTWSQLDHEPEQISQDLRAVTGTSHSRGSGDGSASRLYKRP